MQKTQSFLICYQSIPRYSGKLVVLICVIGVLCMSGIVQAQPPSTPEQVSDASSWQSQWGLRFALLGLVALGFGIDFLFILWDWDADICDKAREESLPFT